MYVDKPLEFDCWICWPLDTLSLVPLEDSCDSLMVSGFFLENTRAPSFLKCLTRALILLSPMHSLMLGINSPPKLFDGCLKIDCRSFWLAFSGAIVGVTYFSSRFNMSLLGLWSLDVLDFLQVLYNFLSYSMVFFWGVHHLVFTLHKCNPYLNPNKLNLVY